MHMTDVCGKDCREEILNIELMPHMKFMQNVSDGLMYKMECCGISGNLLALMQSFLSDRKQRVVLNGKGLQ